MSARSLLPVEEVARLSTPDNAYGVYVSEGHAYVAGGLAGLRIVDVSGNYAFVADWNSGLRIVDISNPAPPQQMGSLDTTGRASDVYVADGYAYVADWDGGLLIARISELSA